MATAALGGALLSVDLVDGFGVEKEIGENLFPVAFAVLELLDDFKEVFVLAWGKDFLVGAAVRRRRTRGW